jgi:hypothetical protein
MFSGLALVTGNKNIAANSFTSPGVRFIPGIARFTDVNKVCR